MNDELAARQRAITLRLAGRSVKAICAAVGRSEVWFRKWWHRYLETGPAGLYDLTRARHHVAQSISPELERAILSIRRRLQAHATDHMHKAVSDGSPFAEIARRLLLDGGVLRVHPLADQRS
jgi:transposase